jgi:NADH-quinone oxidoreductase subunit L
MTPPAIVPFLWLIPGLPLAAALLIVGLGTAKRRLASGLAISAMAASLALAVKAFAVTLQAPGWKGVHNFTWFTFGETPLRIGWLLDPLTASMIVMITLVGLCIFIFSTGYMAGDPQFGRFFAYLSLFSAAMLGLVIANNLLLLFVCWELVGLASYLLIGFWIHKPSAAAAAKKAFITTRIGDIGFLIGILWLYRDAGTLLFYDHGRGCLETTALAAAGASATAVALLVFCGAMGKSGQFPLHVWLPDAMEGPTPVSALIHAATMVAAGVFLVARMFPLFSFGAIDGVTPALTVVVWTGVITALLASVIAIAQADIKRILAYSTVSQLGLMMVSLGVGGWAAGIIHLLAHGFFKALLFLGSGSVIHGCHHEQDIRKMGGLKKLMPVTFLTYSIGMLALSGFPLLFCGAWSKEEILHAAALWPVSRAPYYLMLAGVPLTALYMTRQMIYVFFGGHRGHASGHTQESPAVMTLPLITLAGCSLLFSVVLTPAWPWLDAYLTGESVHAIAWTRLIGPMIFLSLALVLAAIGLGAWMYRAAGSADPLQRSLPGLFRFLENKAWIDELYEATVLAWASLAARISDLLDRCLWDGLVRLVAAIARCVAGHTANFDEGGINTGFDQSCNAALDFGQTLSAWHSGRLQNYLRAIGIGMLALLLIYLWMA